jgi:hypothetical protein
MPTCNSCSDSHGNITCFTALPYTPEQLATLTLIREKHRPLTSNKTSKYYTPLLKKIGLCTMEDVQAFLAATHRMIPGHSKCQPKDRTSTEPGFTVRDAVLALVDTKTPLVQRPPKFSKAADSTVSYYFRSSSWLSGKLKEEGYSSSTKTGEIGHKKVPAKGEVRRAILAMRLEAVDNQDIDDKYKLRKRGSSTQNSSTTQASKRAKTSKSSDKIAAAMEPSSSTPAQGLGLNQSALTSAPSAKTSRKKPVRFQQRWQTTGQGKHSVCTSAAQQVLKVDAKFDQSRTCMIHTAAKPDEKDVIVFNGTQVKYAAMLREHLKKVEANKYILIANQKELNSYSATFDSKIKTKLDVAPPLIQQVTGMEVQAMPANSSSLFNLSPPKTGGSSSSSSSSSSFSSSFSSSSSSLSLLSSSSPLFSIDEEKEDEEEDEDEDEEGGGVSFLGCKKKIPQAGQITFKGTSYLTDI